MVVRRCLAAALVTVALGCAVGPGLGARTEHVLLLTWLFVGPSLLVMGGMATDRDRRVTRQLLDATVPVELGGINVRVGETGHGAFVQGLFRPRIYCDRAVLARFDAQEVRAIVLHEQAHQRAHDPLRLALLDAVDPVVTRSRAGRRWHARRRAAREILADRHALEHGIRRSVLASALLKADDAHLQGTVGFDAAATELRLRALLDDSAGHHRESRHRSLALAAVSGASVCALLVHPVMVHVTG